MNPKSIVRSENARARRILAAHLGIPLHTVHDKGGDYLMVDNRQAYAVLQETSESPGAATWYAIQPFYPK
jgi:hypothetical protein